MRRNCRSIQNSNRSSIRKSSNILVLKEEERTSLLFLYRSCHTQRWGYHSSWRESGRSTGIVRAQCSDKRNFDSTKLRVTRRRATEWAPSTVREREERAYSRHFPLNVLSTMIGNGFKLLSQQNEQTSQNNDVFVDVLVCVQIAWLVE